jgi:hypothetical protein
LGVCFFLLGLSDTCWAAQLKAELWSYAVAMTGRSYKKSVGQLVQSRWGRNKTDDLSSVFCSELVAAALKQLELLPDSLVSANVLPKDLAGDFPLLRGALSPLTLYAPKLHTLMSGKRPYNDVMESLQEDVSEEEF